MSQVLWNSFSSHYRKKFGQSVGKISLSCNHPCPNRDAGGCIFCSPVSFIPSCLDSTDSIERQWQRGKAHASGRSALFFAYFQQETSTAVSFSLLSSMIDTAFGEQDCVGCIISTRPDYLGQDVVDCLSAAAARTRKEILVEVGVQSMHEKSLRLLNRNHSVDDILQAVKRIKKSKQLSLGVHLILGLPGETQKDMRQTLARICALEVDAIKLHHLQVIEKTVLHRMYLQGRVPIFGLSEYLDLLCDLLPLIPERIVLHRLWSHAPPQVLVAPRWNLLSGEVSNLLVQKMQKRRLHQGCSL